MVIVLSKYQITIPKQIRESMGIASGQKNQIIAYRNRIELIPIKPIANMRGFLKGIDTKVTREGDSSQESLLPLALACRRHGKRSATAN